MNPKELCSKLNGVIGFPVTPFNDDHSLDLDGHRENVRHMLEQPMCALVAAGGTGELYSLDPDEVRQVVEATIEEASAALACRTQVCVRPHSSAAFNRPDTFFNELTL